MRQACSRGTKRLRCLENYSSDQNGVFDSVQARQFCRARNSLGLARAERPAVLDGAVNKGFLSTGETREFASENVGFGLNRRG